MDHLIHNSRSVGPSPLSVLAALGALRRPTRHRGIVIDTTAREIKDAEIRAWNKAVDEKKAARKRAKAAS